MNKLLIGAALLGLTFVAVKAATPKNAAPSNENQLPIAPANPTSGDLLVKYNNRIVVDKNGYWMLIKDGRIYPPKDQASILAYQTANPQFKEVLKVTDDIWMFYSKRDSSVFGPHF
jgi:hypothetical protein